MWASRLGSLPCLPQAGRRAFSWKGWKVAFFITFVFPQPLLPGLCNAPSPPAAFTWARGEGSRAPPLHSAARPPASGRSMDTLSLGGLRGAAGSCPVSQLQPLHAGPAGPGRGWAGGCVSAGWVGRRAPRSESRGGAQAWVCSGGFRRGRQGPSFSSLRPPPRQDLAGGNLPRGLGARDGEGREGGSDRKRGPGRWRPQVACLLAAGSVRRREPVAPSLPNLGSFCGQVDT